MWGQYQALKQQHPDTIVFFRLGDFYEVFEEDAKLVARELQITLTSRPVDAGVRVPMAGVPHQSVDAALARLIARGHRVAMAEQLRSGAEAPKRPKNRTPKAADPPVVRSDPPAPSA
jgi:DNA mismatch repair protein MutS